MSENWGCAFAIAIVLFAAIERIGHAFGVW
jgi:hypothetical protein